MMKKSYYDKDVGVSLEMPAEWDAAASEHFALILLAPSKQRFRPNLSFVVKSLKPPTPEHLQQMIDKARKDREASYQGFALVSEERLMQDNYPGHLEVYHWEMDETGTPLTQIFVLILTGPDALYSLHATCLREQETTYLPIFREIIASLRFTPSE